MATEKTEKKGLYEKLALVLAEISRVPKSGRNEHFKYDYVTEADLSDHIRPLLAKYGIGFDFSVVEVVDLPNNITQVKCEVTVSDDTTQIKSFCYGRGQDKNDKGIYKAITGAMKYWLYKSFLVSTGDDPEVDDQGSQDQGGRQQQQGSNGNKNGASTEIDEQAQLRADYKKFESDAIWLRRLETVEKIDEFFAVNKEQMDSNRYKGNYYALIKELRQSIQPRQKAA
jgi:hypothetical protein